MSSVTSTSSGGADTYIEPGSARVPQKVLGQNDFLKLLATQFQVQDPMKPMEDTAFIAQMAQFSSLEQSKNMSSEMSQLLTSQQVATANSYLGHRVMVDAGNDQVEIGDVSAIDNSTGTPSLIVNGNAYSLSSVLRVEPGGVSNPASQPVPAAGA